MNRALNPDLDTILIESTHGRSEYGDGWADGIWYAYKRFYELGYRKVPSWDEIYVRLMDLTPLPKDEEQEIQAIVATLHRWLLERE